MLDSFPGRPVPQPKRYLESHGRPVAAKRGFQPISIAIPFWLDEPCVRHSYGCAERSGWRIGDRRYGSMIALQPDPRVTSASSKVTRVAGFTIAIPLLASRRRFSAGTGMLAEGLGTTLPASDFFHWHSRHLALCWLDIRSRLVALGLTLLGVLVQIPGATVNFMDAGLAGHDRVRQAMHPCAYTFDFRDWYYFTPANSTYRLHAELLLAGKLDCRPGFLRLGPGLLPLTIGLSLLLTAVGLALMRSALSGHHK